jgi:hypothetical protein
LSQGNPFQHRKEDAPPTQIDAENFAHEEIGCGSIRIGEKKKDRSIRFAMGGG